MTTFCEETTSLRPFAAEETIPAGAMPHAQRPPTLHSHVLGRDDLHRPEPRHDFHRADPRRHAHRGNDGTWTGRTKVLHEPVTERLALHEPVTERLVSRDVAVLDGSQLVTPEAEGQVAPPGD
ncbi:MAG: hypothetical protein ACXVGG_15475, partial [Mycobacteriaceae bacterium]